MAAKTYGRPAPGWIPLLLLVVSLMSGCTGQEAGEPTRPSGTVPSPSPSMSAPAIGWLSGAAGDGVADGEFGRWRGSPVTIVGTWADTSADVQVAIDQLSPGGEYGQWSGSVDIAVGAIFRDADETWAAAAAGTYDERWAEMLRTLGTKWSERPRGTLFIRFAHEWNGSWSQWAVNADEIDDFITAWRRFRALQEQILPQAQLVFCTNGDTSGFGYDWRTAWPGDDYVDVYATDWYSELVTDDPFDPSGAPVGLEQHREFALDHGKPFALPEWGNRYSASGDSVEFMDLVHEFSAANGGSGPGQLAYEIYFNVSLTPNDFAIFPVDRTLAPDASATYRRLFG